MYITTTMCDGVLHCLWFAPNVFLVSLHVAINVNVQYNGGFLPDIILCVDSISRTTPVGLIYIAGRRQIKNKTHKVAHVVFISHY